jgi:hypothetical protein
MAEQYIFFIQLKYYFFSQISEKKAKERNASNSFRVLEFKIYYKTSVHLYISIFINVDGDNLWFIHGEIYYTFT